MGNGSVPGAAKVTTFLDDFEICNSYIVQLSGGQHPAKTAPDNNDLNFFVDKLARQLVFDVGVFHKAGKPHDLLILVIAVGAKPLVPFFPVLAP